VDHERGAGELTRPLDTVIGKTDTPLHRRSFLESGWNLLFNDALRAHFDTDLAVSHGFRYGPTIPSGEITLEHLYQAFPMTAPVASGDAYGQQLLNQMESFLTDNFTPYFYEQEDGRVRSYSSNVEVVIDPTAKRNRRLVDLIVNGESVAPESRYSVATVTRPGDPERDLGNCGFPFQNVTVEDDRIPVDVIADYLENHSPIGYEPSKYVTTPNDGGRVQNTPTDGPYPFIQPGVDYADTETYLETRLVPFNNVFPDAGRNRFR
jgi:2',3'-cyclic-nucleotide 2'-phosphodiesterase (5'-nucleotidase family)